MYTAQVMYTDLCPIQRETCSHAGIYIRIIFTFNVRSKLISTYMDLSLQDFHFHRLRQDIPVEPRSKNQNQNQTQ